MNRAKNYTLLLMLIFCIFKCGIISKTKADITKIHLDKEYVGVLFSHQNKVISASFYPGIFIVPFEKIIIIKDSIFIDTNDFLFIINPTIIEDESLERRLKGFYLGRFGFKSNIYVDNCIQSENTIFEECTYKFIIVRFRIKKIIENSQTQYICDANNENKIPILKVKSEVLINNIQIQIDGKIKQIKYPFLKEQFNESLY